MNFIQNDHIDKVKWQKLLSESSFSSPFQTVEFYDLYNRSENFSAHVFANEQEGDYKALVVVTIQKEKGIKGYFSKRGIIYGGPLLKAVDNKILERFLSEIKNYYKKRIIYLEIRNNFDYNEYIKVFEKCGWEYERRLNVQLNVENLIVEDVLSKMKYNRRREIKLSYKEGAITRLAQNENEVELLYDILSELYKDRVKLPLNPLSYFIHLYNNNGGKVFIVEHDGKIIGGAFCFYNNASICTLYYAGLRKYHKKIFPTHLAIMGVIEFAIKNKLKMVDFMGAGKPGEAYGVRDFKLQFGGDLVEHGRFNNIFNPLMFKIGELGLQVMKKLNF